MNATRPQTSQPEADRLCLERKNGFPFPPGIDLIGRYRCHYASPLLLHRHRAWEICHVAKGMMSYVYQGKRVDIPAGSVHICPPDFEHTGFNRKLSPCLLYWIEVVPELLPGVIESGSLFSTPLPQLFAAAAGFAAAVENMLVECTHRSAGWQQMVSSEMQMLLIRLNREFASPRSRESSSPEVRRIVKSLQADRCGQKKLREHLNAAGIGKTLLYRKFREETGFSPQEFRRRQLIAAAQNLLEKTSDSITGIAFTLGFSTSQYFATAFKRETGFSPREWRRAHARNTKMPK